MGADVERGWQQVGARRAPRVRFAQFGHPIAVVGAGMVKPLLAMGEAMAPFIDGDQGAGRQVIEQGGRLGVGQPQEAPHAFGGAALQQLVEGLGAEQLLQPRRHRLPQGIGDQGAMAGGSEAHHLNGIEGALAGGVKFPQFFELFAEKFQPHRQFGAHRKDIDNVAAAAPAALLLDRGDPFVAEAAEGLAEGFEVCAVALAQAVAVGLEGCGRRQVGLQGPFGGDDRQAAVAAIE